jgi:hypothetical protein
MRLARSVGNTIAQGTDREGLRANADEFCPMSM